MSDIFRTSSYHLLFFVPSPDGLVVGDPPIGQKNVDSNPARAARIGIRL